MSQSASQKFVHVAGYNNCGFFTKIVNVLKSVAVLYPSRIKVIEHDFQDRTSYRSWLIDGNEPFRNHINFSRRLGDPTTITTTSAHTHNTSPFVWLSNTDQEICDPKDIESYLGGHDDTIKWCRSLLSSSTTDRMDVDDNIMQTISKKKVGDDAIPEAIHVPDGHTTDHSFDYDLVVIGGGSGGMAAAKEAADLGAKVALLDYVKPSPMGTTWGLGGTCVNVGCIPKKLLHIGSTLRESIHADSAAFGLRILPNSSDNNDKEMTNADNNNDDIAMITEPQTTVHWNIVRDNIQNYIRGLNFKYRVRLREKNVSYLNKLAKFVDAHTIEAIDKNGVSSTITSSRFLIATGGRPASLDCEGHELAVSSDDIFSFEQNPGKTLCVGASYISLECAGFLAGLGCDVTVAVRSILLRGFDRECCEKVGYYMEQMNHLVFKKNVVPIKLTRQQQDDNTNNQKIKVDFSDGTSDLYDTVLTAIGRNADTEKLGVDQIGLKVNPKNGKIIGEFEQTSVPNIYAVGDVLEGSPELTPVAIQAGILLARRLFGNSKVPMDYVNVCTTVFTPIEYSCVGYSEEDAIDKFGESNLEVYHREFLPLEWSLSYSRNHHNCFTKIIVNKSVGNKIIGIHYVGPNAGEIMQGYGVAIKKGITYEELTDTVGIHPTSAEEIVTLSITKRSGEDAAAGGC